MEGSICSDDFRNQCHPIRVASRHSIHTLELESATEKAGSFSGNYHGALQVPHSRLAGLSKLVSAHSSRENWRGVKNLRKTEAGAY
jgi:hypothetical protein